MSSAGNAQLFPAQFELSTLQPANGGDGSSGFVLVGPNPGDRFGIAVSTAGDINGGGVGDLLFGIRNQFAANTLGKSYVIFGTDQGSPPELGLSQVFAAGGGDGSLGFVLRGRRHCGRFPR